VVYLPDDAAAGDTLSGTVVAEPSRPQHGAKLQGYVVEVEGQRAEVRDRRGTWSVPAAATALHLVLRDPRGRVVGREVVGLVAAPPLPITEPAPPALGQAGAPLVIPGPFDGRGDSTAVTLDGRPAEVLAESPRQVVVQSPAEVVGPVELSVREGDRVVTAPYRSVGIGLSADRTTLEPGSSTRLRVEVSGLEGLDQPLEVSLVNETPAVVRLEGGDRQTVVIAPDAVAAGGTFRTERTLTGIIRGGFDLTAGLPVRFPPWRSSPGSPPPAGPGSPGGDRAAPAQAAPAAPGRPGDPPPPVVPKPEMCPLDAKKKEYVYSRGNNDETELEYQYGEREKKKAADPAAPDPRYQYETAAFRFTLDLAPSCVCKQEGDAKRCEGEIEVKLDLTIEGKSRPEGTPATYWDAVLGYALACGPQPAMPTKEVAVQQGDPRPAVESGIDRPLTVARAGAAKLAKDAAAVDTYKASAACKVPCMAGTHARRFYVLAESLLDKEIAPRPPPPPPGAPPPPPPPPGAPPEPEAYLPVFWVDSETTLTAQGCKLAATQKGWLLEFVPGCKFVGEDELPPITVGGGEDTRNLAKLVSEDGTPADTPFPPKEP
jgi:hypothetical protein